MKVIANNKIYVQLNDIKYVLKIVALSSMLVPNSVIDAYFSKVLTCTDRNKYEFQEFSDEEAINFFKKLNYIVDYEELKKMSYNEINEYKFLIYDKMNRIKETFYLTSDKEQVQRQKMIIEYELLEFKMNSVRDFMLYKQGHIKMNLPEIENNLIGTSLSESTGIKQIVKSYFYSIRKYQTKI